MANHNQPGDHTADLDHALAALLHDAPLVLFTIATRDDHGQAATYRVHAYRTRDRGHYEADGPTPGEALADVADQIAYALEREGEVRDGR